MYGILDILNFHHSQCVNIELTLYYYMALFPDNPEHSSQILNHQNYIHHNMECVDQDPIEVILVFDEDGHGQHYSTPGNNRRMDTAPPPPVTLPPQLTGSLGQNYMGKF